jgi:hypothetical protein
MSGFSIDHRLADQMAGRAAVAGVADGCHKAARGMREVLGHREYLSVDSFAKPAAPGTPAAPAPAPDTIPGRRRTLRSSGGELYSASESAFGWVRTDLRQTTFSQLKGTFA